ncbi:MAG: vWA domain-containing protein [Polyangiaceae bacterium]
MLDLLSYRLLASRTTDDPRLEPLLVQLAEQSIRDRAPYFGWLLELAADEERSPAVRAAALLATQGAHGWAVAECAVDALAHPELRAAALTVLVRLAENAPMRWVHVAFHPDEAVRRAAYAAPRPEKTRVFDLFLLADAAVRDAVLRDHEAHPLPFESGDLYTLVEMVDRGFIAAASARAALVHHKGKFMAAIQELAGETDLDARAAFTDALTDPASLEGGAARRARLMAFLRALPPTDDVWLSLLRDQGQRGMRHRLAVAAWTLLPSMPEGPARDGVVELVLLLDLRFIRRLPEPEARRHLRSLGERRLANMEQHDTVRSVVQSPLVAVDGELDLAVLAAVMAFVNTQVFEKLIEWVGVERLVAAVSRDERGARLLGALPPRGNVKFVSILEKLPAENRVSLLVGIFLEADIARFGELGLAGAEVLPALLRCADAELHAPESDGSATMDRERATAIAGFAQGLLGPGILRKALPPLLRRRREPGPLAKALIRESAIASEADPYVEHVTALAGEDLEWMLECISRTEGFPMGKELALAHALAGSSSKHARAWARSRLPEEEAPTRELPRSAAGVAFRATSAAPAATIDESVARAVALLGSADPVPATDAALAAHPFGNPRFDGALDTALVAAFGVRTGGLSPLGHACLWRWDAHALLHLELCVAEHGSLGAAIRARLGLVTRALRRTSIEAIVSALDIHRYRDRPRFRSLLDADLVDALTSALPGDAEIAAARGLRRIFESSEISLADALPAIRSALPELGDEARRELAPIVDSKGLPPRRPPRAPDAEVDAETLAKIRACSDVAILSAFTEDRRAIVVQEATLRLILLGEQGQAVLAERLEQGAAIERVSLIIESLPLWSEGPSLDRARRVLELEPFTERAFRVALAFLERGDAACLKHAIDAARDPLESGWFRAEDWDKLLPFIPARGAARALSTSPQPHASLRAVEVLLTGEIDAEDASALRAYLDCGTERMGSQRRRAAMKLLEVGDPYGLPIAIATSLDETKGKSSLFAHVDAERAAMFVRGLLAAGGTIVKEASIVHHVVAMPFHTSEDAFREILDRATTDQARMTAARYAGSRASRERKLMRVVETFSWGVRVARRLLGKPMRVRMTGSQSLGFTRTRENVVYVTPLPILRGDRHGAEIVEALIIHEVGHHMFHAGKANEGVWSRAEKAGIGGLLNLVADEHLERNIRALDREHGDRLKRLAAYAFQHTKRMLPVRRVLSHVGAAAVSVLPGVGLGVARDDASVMIETGSFLFTLEKSALSFARFARALRMGLGNRHADPKVAEALELFGPSFKSSTMEQLLEIADKLRLIFGWETNLCESFGAHESIEDQHGDAESVVWGEGLSQDEVDRMVRRITERSEAPASSSGGGGLAINVGADESFNRITRVERKVFDASAHAPYARRVQRPAQLLRRYFEELGLGFRPERMRLSGRRLDQTRLLPLVLHGDPRLLVARHAFFARDLFLGIVVDCSGSMAARDNMERGKLFAALLAESAAPLSGIDTRVLGFTDQVIYDCGDARRCAAHALAASGGNNDAAALYHLATIAKQSQRKAKVLVMVSDGLPTECTVAALRGLVRQLGQRERMVCAQVAVQALAEVCFPHYVVLSDASIETTVNKFGALVAKLVARAVGGG